MATCLMFKKGIATSDLKKKNHYENNGNVWNEPRHPFHIKDNVLEKVNLLLRNLVMDCIDVNVIIDKIHGHD